jgi:DNA-binding transcriptional MerR regulator
MDGPWTLAELTAEAAAILATEQPTQASGRVRDLPNERLIRWYVTIGLVDPPQGRRGRVALYGRRHLLQLVAVKRRQALGHTLAQIQQELVGATDEMLQAAVELTGPDGAADPPRQSSRFWTSGASSADRREGVLVRGVRLRPEVTLMIDVGELSAEDLAAITAAAVPLIDTLAARGLIPLERSAP